MRKYAAIAVIALATAGCSSAQLAKFDSGLVNFNGNVQKYAPLIGRDILMIGETLVVAYCSPITPVAGQTAANVLNIVAPNSSAAKSAQNILAANAAISSQLCPLVTAIKASVGTVPVGNPSQVIPAS